MGAVNTARKRFLIVESEKESKNRKKRLSGKKGANKWFRNWETDFYKKTRELLKNL